MTTLYLKSVGNSDSLHFVESLESFQLHVALLCLLMDLRQLLTQGVGSSLYVCVREGVRDNKRCEFHKIMESDVVSVHSKCEKEG